MSRETLYVLVDMDGVLCDFESYALDVFRSKYPSESYVNLCDRKTFYIKDQYKELGEHLPELVDKLMREKEFFLRIPEIEGAVEAVKTMSGIDGVEVFICTTPISDSEFCAQEKMEWIRRHMGVDWLNRLIMTHDKTLVAGHLLIDDKHRITGAMRKPSWDHILFSQCHNMHISEFSHSSSSNCNNCCSSKSKPRSSSRTTAVERLHSWLGTEWRELIERYKKLNI